jgi:NAD-dependent SIR2 family protein deacetylase
MVPLALRNGAQVVIVNQGQTPFDDAATVLRGPISELLPQLVDAVVNHS